MPAFPEEERRTPEPRGQRPVALLCIGAAIVLLLLPPEAHDQVSRTLRGTVLQPFVAVQEFVAQARITRAEFEELRVRKDSLVARATALESLAEENRRLRDLLDLRERAGPDFVPASVVRPATRGAESIFVIDVGSRDGVVENAPVIAERGLVGVVREVSPGNAVAMDWTHPDFRVGVMTRGGEIYGIAQPQRGPFRETDRLLLDGLPYHAHLERSTAIVTSGLGGVYPRGLAVGTVEEIHDEGAGWRRSYRLEPAVEVGSVTHVLVLTGDALPDGSADEDDFVALWDPEPASSEEGFPEEVAAGSGGWTPGSLGVVERSGEPTELVGPEELEGPPDPEAPPAQEEVGEGLPGGEHGVSLFPDPLGARRVTGGVP